MTFFKIRITAEAIVFVLLAAIALVNRDGKVAAQVLFANANVSVSQTGPNVIDMSKPATYVITVTNAGPRNAKGVVVSSIVPPGLGFLPDASDGRCMLAGRIVQCDTDAEEDKTLAPGNSISFTVSYIVHPEFGCQATVLHTALAETAHSLDPDFNDNTTHMLSSFSCAKKPSAPKVIKKGAR